MSLVEHAKSEFRAAGWCDENGKCHDEMQQMICDDVIQLLDVFGEQGHSGSSAPYAIDLFTKLAKFEPLVPLTGEDWEWMQVSNFCGDSGLTYQNKRASRVFKDESGAYDIDGKVFWEWIKSYDTGEPIKSYYTCRESRTPVEFPYTPKTEYVYRWSDAEPKSPKQNEEGFINE